VSEALGRRVPEHAFKNGTLSLSGYGLRVAVERGHLVVEDGVGLVRRRSRFARVLPEFQRLIILGHSGTVTLDAIRWLHDIGASFAHIDSDGTLLSVSAGRTLNNASLRRAQALAQLSGTGLSIARRLIGAKLEGQAEVAARIGDAKHIASAIREALPHVEAADSLERLRYVEARAAMAYWTAWEHVALRFTTRDRKRVPNHWTTFGKRRSVLSGRNQRAINPANAVLNYLYAVAEAEAQIQLTAAGLDPGVGIVHADREARASLALDILEAVRPQIEAHAVDLFEAETFSRDDFFETRAGNCRVMPRVAKRLAATAGAWAESLAFLARRVARDLERSGAAGFPLVSQTDPAPRVAPRASLPALLRGQRPTAGATRSAHGVERRCRHCGERFVHTRNVHCDTCIPLLPSLASERARDTLRERKRSGDTVVSRKTRQRIGSARRDRVVAMREWEAAHRTIPASHVFTETLWPLLKSVTAQQVRASTGLSISYCRRVLRGQYVPHPMHWEALRKLAEGD
jgi:CRISPR-associated endonuclease Cas1